MSKGQMLRALVNERLAAAAEEIFVLIERTIAEYEEEVCRSREENQRKQQFLDTILRQRQFVQIPPVNTCPGLIQKVTEVPQIKEEPKEHSNKHEKDQLPELVPESSAACVKTEDSILQQSQNEHKEGAKGEDIRSEPLFHSEMSRNVAEGHTDNDKWGPPLGYTASQMETEVDGDHYNQVHVGNRNSTLSPQNQPAPETSVHSGTLSGPEEAERKRHQCPFCQKRFGTKQSLQTHIRIHTGEKPYGCHICRKTFTQKSSLNLHLRIHTGEKPFSCSFCKKTFAQKCNLKTHMITHQGSALPPDFMAVPAQCSLYGTRDVSL